MPRADVIRKIKGDPALKFAMLKEMARKTKQSLLLLNKDPEILAESSHFLRALTGWTQVGGETEDKDFPGVKIKTFTIRLNIKI